MSKVISGDGLNGFQRWELPEVECSHARHGTNQNGLADSLPTADQIEGIQKQAYQEGFEQGRSEGLLVGQAEIRTQGRYLREILDKLHQPLTDLDNEVVDEMVALAMLVARHIIRREIKMDPGQIIAAVREATAALPVASKNIRLRLHPDDVILVRDALSLEEGVSSGWHIVEDPGLSRGGCYLETETSQIDATIEKRLAAMVARMMGGEREQDNAKHG